jgi:beta-glucosidase
VSLSGGALCDLSLERGMDNECADFLTKVKDDHDHKPFIVAVQQGYLNERAIDTASVRLFTARIRLGMFDRLDRSDDGDSLL